MMNAVMAAGDAGTMLPIDAINEFQTQQNPRAEYGWKPGAVVNVGIKSGSNATTARPTPTAARRLGRQEFLQQRSRPAAASARAGTIRRQCGRPHHPGQAVLLRQLRVAAIQRRQPVRPQCSVSPIRPIPELDRRLPERTVGREPQRSERPISRLEQQLHPAFELPRLVPGQTTGQLPHRARQHENDLFRRRQAGLPHQREELVQRACFS